MTTERYARGELVSRTLATLEQLALLLSELGIDVGSMPELRPAAEALFMLAARQALEGGLSTLPRIEQTTTWTVLGLQDGIGELGERLKDCLFECSKKAEAAQQALSMERATKARLPR